jgi:crotonobetainyl-CoA hydratase
MLLTGRRMDADEAARWGLVNRVVEPGEVRQAAIELASEIREAAPMAVRATKAIVDASETLTVQEAYAALRSGKIPVYDQVLESEDAKEGPNAFAEGRDPIWKGR